MENSSVEKEGVVSSFEKKTAASQNKAAVISPNKKVTAASPSQRALRASSSSSQFSFFSVLKKVVRKLDAWNVGWSGKVILILIVIGVFSKLVQKLL